MLAMALSSASSKSSRSSPAPHRHRPGPESSGWGTRRTPDRPRRSNNSRRASAPFCRTAPNLGDAEARTVGSGRRSRRQSLQVMRQEPGARRFASAATTFGEQNTHSARDGYAAPGSHSSSRKPGKPVSRLARTDSGDPGRELLAAAENPTCARARASPQSRHRRSTRHEHPDVGLPEASIGAGHAALRTLEARLDAPKQRTDLGARRLARMRLPASASPESRRLLSSTLVRLGPASEVEVAMGGATSRAWTVFGGSSSTAGMRARPRRPPARPPRLLGTAPQTAKAGPKHLSSEVWRLARTRPPSAHRDPGHRAGVWHAVRGSGVSRDVRTMLVALGPRWPGSAKAAARRAPRLATGAA